MKRINYVIKARWRIRVIYIYIYIYNKCTFDTFNKPFFHNFKRSTYLLRWNFTAKLKRESIVGNLRNVEIVMHLRMSFLIPPIDF